MTTSALKMFSIGYKPIPYAPPPGWVEPFAVGPLAADPSQVWRDAGQGDSIAHLNDSFGELTAHYWVWKNLRGVERIGFCHYRRYFNFLDLRKMDVPQLLTEPVPAAMAFLNKEEQRQRALEILRTSDIIATRTYGLNQTVAAQFCEAHSADIWRAFIETVETVSPVWLRRYLPWFDLSYECRFYPVFIMPWEIFDEFCSLLFPVLFALHKRVGAVPDEAGRRFQLGRYPAFLSERFMMLYFHARGLRVHGAQLVRLERDT